MKPALKKEPVFYFNQLNFQEIFFASIKYYFINLLFSKNKI